MKLAVEFEQSAINHLVLSNWIIHAVMVIHNSFLQLIQRSIAS